MNRILFIKKGKFSNANAKVIRQLNLHFKGHSIEVLNLEAYLNKKPIVLIINIFFTIKEYGLDFLSGKKHKDDIKKVFFCTTFLFKHIKKVLEKKVMPGYYTFTFQTQSMHDCSSPGTPHFVYTDHTALANYHYPDISIKKYEKSPGYIKLEQTVYKNATKVFVFGGQVARSLVDDYQLPASKIACVGAGYNVQVSSPPADEARYARKEILFVGIEWERKGGPMLVEAFQRILPKHPDAQLTIVGSSPKVTLSNCTVVGRVPLSEVSKYFEQASIFCMPSVREPFGIVYIEAMLYRLPVVALNLGATPDFIQPGVNGFVVENNVEDLANALDQLLQSPSQCQAFGEQGYQIAYQRYSWDYIGDTICSEIKSALPVTHKNEIHRGKQG